MAHTAPGRANTIASPDPEKGSGPTGSGHVVEVTLKPATGGMISETRRMTKGKFGSDYSHETAVHPKFSHLVKHLKSVMGKPEGHEKKKSRMGKV